VYMRSIYVIISWNFPMHNNPFSFISYHQRTTINSINLLWHSHDNVINHVISFWHIKVHWLSHCNVKNHVISFWHIKVHWLSHDNLCENLWHIKVHWPTHDHLCEKFLPFYYACEITWGAMWCVDFRKFLI
jgi:hypothetical protein